MLKPSSNVLIKEEKMTCKRRAGHMKTWEDVAYEATVSECQKHEQLGDKQIFQRAFRGCMALPKPWLLSFAL